MSGCINYNPCKRLGSFISPRHGTLTSTTTPGLSGPGGYVIEGLLHNPETPELQPHHQMQFNVISRSLNSFKYCYLALIILFNIEILLCNTGALRSPAKSSVLLFVGTKKKKDGSFYIQRSGAWATSFEAKERAFCVPRFSLQNYLIFFKTLNNKKEKKRKESLS